MRLTEFWRRMETRFGHSYAHSVAADYRLPTLGSTIDDALSRGVDVKEIWHAVCQEFDVPGQLR
ncbi:MAG: DUF3046 domain-containing protein [Solirubrobacteraceae bacterium]